MRALGPRLDECIHCGFCLPACPTYTELGRETDSPRGRIWLVRALVEERIRPTGTVLDHLDGCLDCRACETACPSGVRYGEIIETAREALEPKRRRGPVARLMRFAGLRVLLRRRRLLRAVAAMLRWLERGGLRARLERSELLPENMRRMLRLAPRVTESAFTATSPAVHPAEGSERGRVALFTGCVTDAAMAPLHRATVRALVRNGFAVEVTPGQVCCGALHVHNGDGRTARELSEINAAAFAESDADSIVVNAAGCGARLSETSLGARTVDVTAFLAARGLRATPPRCDRTAVYDDPCHLQHAQGVTEAPRELLRAVPGLRLLPLDEADRCCGGAGVYNLTQPEMARRLLARKMERIERSGANLVVTANPGCMLQLRAGVAERGLAADVVHVVELL